jgi:ATP-dependent Lhr-like helicase
MATILAQTAVDYLAATRAALGVVPSQSCVVAERFFDEGGGMQLVVHAPFGARLNRAWGLALRKSFCRTFDFELQAAATDDGIVLSLGAQHSFPLEAIFDFVRPDRAREVLVQAALQAPMFGTRWRWNTTRALAVPRRTSKGKLPPLLQRMRAEDLLAAVFPAQTGCQDNHGGEAIEPPDHPLVNQTMRDCLDEVMDVEGLRAVLERLMTGDLRVIARDTPEPSPIAAQILNANPYAYLDDAPLEERRTRAVSMRRGLPAEVASEMGALDPEAIASVRESAWPAPRDADELHDTLCLCGAWPEAEAGATWHAWMEELIAKRRATRIVRGGFTAWVAAERLPMARAAYDGAEINPVIAAAPGAKEAEREGAIMAIVRGRLEHVGPTTVAALASALGFDESDVTIACAQIENEGAILRGRFSKGAGEEWCDRRLLARIHRMTLGRLRREIEPVEPAQLGRFLAHWQHVAPGTQLHGATGLSTVIGQLQGIEAPVGQWESSILPARVAGYTPALLDELCLSGEIMWGRRSASQASITTRATPITFFRREAAPWIVPIRESESSDESPAAIVAGALKARGALFYAELAQITGLLRAQLDDALWALVATGRATADGFGALRSLAGDGARRTGRWALLENLVPLSVEAAAEQFARQLLDRYGVVFRELMARELLPVWRELLVVLRRLEARGEIRGGRFVAGYVGEQFALPQAVDALRALRRSPAELTPLQLSARDPLRGLGLLEPPSTTPSSEATV